MTVSGMQRTPANASSEGSLVPALAASIPAVIVALVVLSLILVAGEQLALTHEQTVSLIVVNYITPGLLCIALALWFRQPLLVGFNISALVFLTSLAGMFSYAEMLGATFLSGLVIALIGLLGLSQRIAQLLPAPIVFGVLGGLVLPFLINVFSELGQSLLLVGIPLGVFLLMRRYPISRIPPILPAAIAAFLLAYVLGELQSPGVGWVNPGLAFTMPEFSRAALVTIVPVVTVLIAVQGNLSAVVYLSHQKYDTPARAVDVSTGISSALISFFGAGLISMASMLSALTGGPDAGEHRLRYWSVIASGIAFALTGLLAGVIVTAGSAVPMALLITLAGLALIGVLTQALQEITRGPLVLGPLFAFAITLSDLSIGGLGSVFWALVIGTGVSAMLEGHRIFPHQKTPDPASE